MKEIPDILQLSWILGVKLVKIGGMNLYSKISRILEDTPLSDKAVSRELLRVSNKTLKVSEATVRRWRIGESKIKFEQAVWLARLFSVPLEYLTNDEIDVMELKDLEAWRDVIRIVQALGPKHSYDILIGKSKPLREWRKHGGNGQSS